MDNCFCCCFLLRACRSGRGIMARVGRSLLWHRDHHGMYLPCDHYSAYTLHTTHTPTQHTHTGDQGQAGGAWRQHTNLHFVGRSASIIKPHFPRPLNNNHTRPSTRPYTTTTRYDTSLAVYALVCLILPSSASDFGPPQTHDGGKTPPIPRWPSWTCA